MTDLHAAAQRIRAYLDALPSCASLGAQIVSGPEFTAANGRPAGHYALDRADLEAVLSVLDQLADCGHSREYHGPEFGCVECRCTSTNGHG
jgi:hypothetical protein